MGSRPLGAFSGGTRTGEVPNCCHRLLYHVGGGRAASRHIIGQLPKVHVKANDNQIWDPEVVISDNGTQFADKKFGEFLAGLGIKQMFLLVEHPQTNGQVEAANKVILQGLKRRLDHKKGAWADEVDAIIPVEIGEPSPRLILVGIEEAVEKDLVDEAREMAHLSEIALKQRMALRYNAKVLKREFEQNDLVLRRNDIGLPTPGEGKLAANWEGPYRVKEVIGRGAYRLERLDGKEVPRTWNAVTD
ncbi:uncharacterized protein [Arachis hypogaea]|uniref:uncharacterized protein n=1 Tax=Arachis hypogaea TaxID=3818 RepID=UPI003B225442